MARMLSILLLLAATLSGFSQSDSVSISIHGSLFDGSSMKAIEGVHISVLHSKTGTTSQVDGSFRLNLVLPKDSFPVNLLFSHVAYEDHISSVSIGFKQHLDLKLIPKIKNMKVVEVYSGPYRIASPYFSQILDYEVYNQKIVLLEKMDRSRKNRIRVVDFQGNLLGETTVRGKAISLFKDCREEVYLIMQDRYLKIHHDIEVSVSVSSQNLENRIKNPCRVRTDSFLIYEEYGYARLISWFFKHDFYNKNNRLFYYSADKHTMRMIQEDLLILREKYGNVIQDLMYIETNLGDNPESRIRNLVLDEDLSESLFYKPNYCPIFYDHGNILAFDHGHGQIVTLSTQGKVLDKQRIKYQQKLAWEPFVFQDETNGKYFTMMKRGSWMTLYSVDPSNGIASSFHKIGNVFPEKVKLHNGFLMYLYRKPQTPDRYSLYLERY